MKTKIIFILLCVLSLNVMGQGIITRESTRRTKAKKSKTEQPARQNSVRKQATSKHGQNSSPLSQPSGYVNGHGYVDLGLSVKWATCNVGASNPSDYGGYYAWGETSTKSRYDWENLKYRTSGDSYDNVKFSKYVTKSKYGSVDNKTRLEMSDDAARQNWGSTWRMPTDAENEELCNKCKWTWTSKNGHNGYTVTGPNGNSIFLPAAAWRHGTDSNNVGVYGAYWSSTLSASDSSVAGGLGFGSSSHSSTGSSSRSLGQSVRPVTE